MQYQVQARVKISSDNCLLYIDPICPEITVALQEANESKCQLANGYRLLLFLRSSYVYLLSIVGHLLTYCYLLYLYYFPIMLLCCCTLPQLTCIDSHLNLVACTLHSL